MYGKIQIKGTLETVSGLHIGGSSAFAPIGSVNNPIVYDTLSKLPMIPGSTLKGKMRSLLAREACLKTADKKLPTFDNESDDIKRLFGFSSKDEIIRGHLLFSDTVLKNMSELRKWGIQSPTEIKWENTIDRIAATAMPRQNERVIRGAKFDVEWIYEVDEEDSSDGSIKKVCYDMEILLKAIKLLEYDYLGGNGSRGDGKIKIYDLVAKKVVQGDLPDKLLDEVNTTLTGNHKNTADSSEEETK